MDLNISELLNTEKVQLSHGEYNCYSALLAEKSCFKIVSSTETGLANSRVVQTGIGLFSVSDNLNAVSVWYVVKEFEAGGAASTSIEDQISPKRCGHVRSKEVITPDEMERMVSVVIDARNYFYFVIVVRTDVIPTDGIKGAVDREKATSDSGSYVTIPDEVTGRGDIDALVQSVDVPFHISIGFGLRTRSIRSLMSISELSNLGVRWLSLSCMLVAAAIQEISGAHYSMAKSIVTSMNSNRSDLFSDVS